MIADLSLDRLTPATSGRLADARRAAPRVSGWPRRSIAWIAGVCLIVCSFSLEPSAAVQSSSDPADASATTAADPAREAFAVPARPGDPIDITFDDLKFDIEKGGDYKPSMLTEAIKQLDGQTIRVRGFVRPSFKQTGIKNFILVRDNQECCFGPGAALYDCVMVKMADDQSIDFTVRPVTMVGTLYLKEFIGKDKKVWAIFRMKDARQE